MEDYALLLTLAFNNHANTKRKPLGETKLHSKSRREKHQKQQHNLSYIPKGILFFIKLVSSWFVAFASKSEAKFP
ncbi:CLUMA_CG009187, isoform A [Clunio marinus]|uniref:CLUMA_CG009187, isoform A n=1 Tax=Clunio marinus TaxID=568069 RepID=A0A1J1I7L6_9DIPT|nr:CLUMA_CG009187, isoform A [Clunio marinus]